MIDNYELTVDGVLRQIKIEKESSNSSLNLAKNCHYFNYYNSFDEKPMNELRYNLMVSDMTKEEIYHLCILDFGYGSGTFVKYCFEEVIMPSFQTKFITLLFTFFFAKPSSDFARCLSCSQAFSLRLRS